MGCFLGCVIVLRLSGDGASGTARAPFFLDAGASVRASLADPTSGSPVASIRLAVPFESQLNNASGEGYRECFTSSCAMLARFWQKVPSDDAYARLRRPNGDSTSAQAQIQTLRALGLRADFWSNGRRLDLEREIQGGRPVAVGWLHKGKTTAPYGGHWSVIIGLEGELFRMHDPYGEPLLRSGGHRPGSSGAAVLCSWAGFLPRWCVEGPATGWFVTCSC